jgi:hypothetical protein
MPLGGLSSPLFPSHHYVIVYLFEVHFVLFILLVLVVPVLVQNKIVNGMGDEKNKNWGTCTQDRLKI